MMPARQVVNNESSVKYHRLTRTSDDGFVDMQVGIMHFFQDQDIQ